MLANIRSFFEKNIMKVDAAHDEAHQLRLATAALLIEMMQQDDEVHDKEYHALMSALREKFDLSEDETKDLIELAHEEAASATDYHQFTSLIAKQFSQPQKIKVIEYLWLIAFADGHLDRYEEHMVRRIAVLIYVSHADYMQAKHRVENKLNSLA